MTANDKGPGPVNYIVIRTYDKYRYADYKNEPIFETEVRYYTDEQEAAASMLKHGLSHFDEYNLYKVRFMDVKLTASVVPMTGELP